LKINLENRNILLIFDLSKKHITMNPQEIETLKETHEKIRNILIDYGNEEFGDAIIDEICVAVGILPTTVYYDEK
jgi:hypothetical protein